MHNTTLKENIGGNMFLSLDGFMHSIVTIADSYFQGGHTSHDSGGIFMFTTYNASQFSQHVKSNLVYINNTEFVGNHGEGGGAMAVIPCTGTELHIYGSKFRDNKMSWGAHHFCVIILK